MSNRKLLLASWTLANLKLSDRHFLAKTRKALRTLQESERFEAIRAAHWRHKNGLEHRCLVALLHAPEVLKEASGQISSADFLTPAYAGLAEILFGPYGQDAAQVGAGALGGRPYLPDPSTHNWTNEAREAISRLVERRARWDIRRRGRRWNPAR